MKQLKVYFNQKKTHRERQKDTVKYAPKEIKIIGKEKVKLNNIEVFKHHNNYWRSKAVKLITKLPLLNLRKIPAKHKKADYVYVWGLIPLNSKKPFVIELDNPYSLTFYKKFAFNLYKPIIKKILKSKKCHKIVCISEACKLKTIDLLGKDIEKKIIVQYPYMKKLTKSPKHKKINYLFIGFDFEGKGGIELIKAFKERNKNNILNIIGPNKKNKKDKNINWLGKIDRKQILSKELQKNDILCFPTYYESLGLVALEAVSAGLGIITTNTFALPELVKDNGILLNNPFLKPKRIAGKKLIDPTDLTLGQFKKKYGKKMPSEKLTKEIIKALKESEKKSEEWKENSIKLYETKFSEKIWKENFLKIFE